MVLTRRARSLDNSVGIQTIRFRIAAKHGPLRDSSHRAGKGRGKASRNYGRADKNEILVEEVADMKREQY